MRSTAKFLVFALAAAVAGCGGKGPSGPGDDAPMSASINGMPWRAASTPGAAIAARTAGALAFSGSNQDLRAIGFSIPEVTRPGTIPLEAFGSASVQDVYANSIWITGLDNARGSVTITSISAERVSGTFRFTAAPLPNTSARGTVEVTKGRFDLRF